MLACFNGVPVVPKKLSCYCNRINLSTDTAFSSSIPYIDLSQRMAAEAEKHYYT